MPGPRAVLIILTPRQKEILSSLDQKVKIPLDLSLRVKIILLAAEGMTNAGIARELGTTRSTVRKWRRRWHVADAKLGEAELEDNPGALLLALAKETLADAPRSGTPATFTPEQLVAIIAIACEDPVASGNPCTKWTAKEVAFTAAVRHVVPDISPRTVQRYFREVDFKPHRMRYYTNRPGQDPDFAPISQEICAAYKAAADLKDQRVHLVCLDEKTGIQALEPILPTLRPRPGLVERRGHAYLRHGTLDLIISFEVAEGTILHPTVSPTRTEVDFCFHVAETIEYDPEASWVFVLDQLNTHLSESLVYLVARLCKITDDLGTKGKSGVLKSMESRKAFLEDKSHRIRFLYTPKHASWLNQAEIWFSILVRKLLRRGVFASLADLETKIRKFVHNFNDYLGKPFRWTYAGRPLVAA
jgi:transposase